ncbi:hypothetical protein CONCODRAFT_5641, partial [Conidiobolus coronatus NRRL 28638]
MLPKVLCLHGYAQNIFVDAPHLIPGNKRDNCYSKFSARDKELIGVNGMRCWWDYNSISYLTLVLNSIRYINQVIDNHGPFIGIIGFSQGACLAFILNNLIESNSPLINKSQKSLNFIVLYSGFFPSDRRVNNIVTKKSFNTPSLIVLDNTGRDKVVKAEKTLYLERLLKNSG